jgi:SPP1 family predicted phage head-tail adaptor
VDVRAGRLRERIQIQAAGDVSNGRGGYVRTWTTIAEPFAEALSQNGREAVIASSLQGFSVVRFTIRFRDGISNVHRIIWRGREFNISSAEPDHSRQWLTILANSGSPQG